MTAKSARELHEEWQKARDELERLREDYGFVARSLKPGQRIETPPKAVTPEALEQIQQLEQRVDDLWKAYKERVGAP